MPLLKSNLVRIRTILNSVRIRSNSEVSFTNSHYDFVENRIRHEFARFITRYEFARIRRYHLQTLIMTLLKSNSVRIRTILNSVRIRSNSEVSFTNSHYDSVEIEFGTNSLQFGGIIVEIEFARIRANSNSVRIRSNSEVPLLKWNSLQFVRTRIRYEFARIRKYHLLSL